MLCEKNAIKNYTKFQLNIFHENEIYYHSCLNTIGKIQTNINMITIINHTNEIEII
jgi:hypothetical protein